MKNEYKKIFDTIKPDEKLVERIFERSEQMSRKNTVFPMKRALAGAMCFILFATGIGVGYNHFSKERITGENGTSSVSSNPSFDFDIIAYAEDSKSGDVKVLKDDDVMLMSSKAVKASDGGIREYSSTDGLSVRADADIDSVIFESELGIFNYLDNPLKQQLIRKNKLYAAVIELTKEEFESYNDGIEQTQSDTVKFKQDFVKQIMEKRDCTAFVYDDGFDPAFIGSGYKVYASDMAQEREHYYSYCLLIEKVYTVTAQKGSRIEAKTYQKDDKIEYVYYSGVAVNENSSRPADEISFEDLPTDTIKITVKYKSGQSVTKEILVKYNKDGEMTMQYK